MEKFIKYQRFYETHTETSLQDFFDKLISSGFEIIYYDELKLTELRIFVTVIAGKKQSI
jgi:hypothetical protein